MSSTIIADSALIPGTTLQNFQIESTIGVDPWGITYLAIDSSQGIRVAIREFFPRMLVVRNPEQLTIHVVTPNQERIFEQVRQAFAARAQQLMVIQHPNLASVTSTFDALGTSYFVMPCIPSNPLILYGIKERGKRLPQKQCESLLRGILDGLACLHSHQMVHGLIHPSQILINTETGMPMLSGLGYVDLPSDTPMLGDMEPFAAPEVLLGKSPSAGSDLYSLGASIYYILTGEFPQRGDTRLYSNTHIPLASKPDLRVEYDEHFLKTIDTAMIPVLIDRFQSASDWFTALDAPAQLPHPQAKRPALQRSTRNAGRRPIPRPVRRPAEAKTSVGSQVAMAIVTLALVSGIVWYVHTETSSEPTKTTEIAQELTVQKSAATTSETKQVDLNKAQQTPDPAKTPGPVKTTALATAAIGAQQEQQTTTPAETTAAPPDQKETSTAIPAIVSIPETTQLKAPEINISKSKLPQDLLDKIKAGDYDGVRLSVLDSIRSMYKGDQAPITNPQFCHLLSVSELIKVTTPAELSKFHRSSPEARAFMLDFLNDPEWLELYLGAGLVPENTSLGLSILSSIWNAEGKSPDFRSYLSLATGIANVWSVGPFAERLQKTANASPLTRFRYFRHYHKKKQLHPGFMALRPWEIRFVAGHPVDDAAYEWIVEHVNLPWRRYVDACWFADYTGTSVFGDSIQGALFYVPWRDMYNEAEQTKRHGAVCGGLSYLGTLASSAHGMPAYPVGQPGHCAYAVRMKRGDWQGGFGGPDGGMHNFIFGSNAPTSYMLMEAVFQDDKQIDHAYRYARLASAMMQLKDNKKALAAINQAVAYSPIHPTFRQIQQDLMTEIGETKPEDWYNYAREAITHYKGNGYAALDALKTAEGSFVGVIQERDKLEWYTLLHNVLATTKTSWAVKISDVLNGELGNMTSEWGREQFLQMALTVHLNSVDSTNFGQVLEWAVKTFVNGQEDQTFNRAFTAAAASLNAGSPSMQQTDGANKLRSAYGKAIFAAEQARSIPAFQALSKAAIKLSTPKDEETPTFSSELPPGRLVPAANCMVRLSTTSNWDRQWEHIDLLKPCGGFCHTDKEAIPHVIVELPTTLPVSGLLVTKADGNEGRMKKVRISTSTDGATWFPLQEMDDMPKEWRIALPESKQAKWVKFEAINDAETNYLHLKHFLIFVK